MHNKYRNIFLSIFLTLVMCISQTNINIVKADDGTPTDPPPPAQSTDVATQPPVVATDPATQPADTTTDASSFGSTPVPPDSPTSPGSSDSTSATDQAPTDPPATDLVTTTDVAPEINSLPADSPTLVSTDANVVVLDANGGQLALGTQQASDIIANTDPMWCPAGILPGGAGCTTNFASVLLLQTDINNNASNYAHNGIIYFTSTASSSFTLTSASIGSGDFNSIKPFNLTLQGGWNGLNGANTFLGQTDFGSNSISIGTNANRWIGNITLSNFTFNTSSSTPISVFTTTGNIVLDNVDVSNQANNLNTATLQSNSGNITVQNGSSFDGDNSGTNQSKGFSATTAGSGSINISNTTFQDSIRTGNPTYNGATLSAPTITLTNVTSNNNDGSGISVSNYNLLTLNNVTANGNGTGDATLTGNVGSGVTAVGLSGSRLIVIGGSFNNNKRYGIDDTTSTVYIQSNPICSGNVGGCYNVPTIFDNTPPTISPNIAGTLGTNGWYKSNVSVSWTVSDPQSGVLSSTGCTSASLNSDSGGTLLTCSATNNAGLSNSVSVTIKIDKTAPLITFVNRTPANGNGWNNTDVTVNWSCTDAGSGVVSGSISQTLSTESAGQSATGTCFDNAGNTSSNTQAGINIDKTAPTITFISRTPANGNGWNNNAVTVNWTCFDNGSGVVSAALSQTLASEGAGQSASGTCLDKAGNVSTNTQSGINIDETNPVLNLPADILAEATGPSGATINYSAAVTDNLDAGISIVCLPASGTIFSITNATVNCSAADLANNPAAGSFHVTVQDTTPPVIAAHSDVFDATTHTTGSNVIFTIPTTSDAVDGAGSANCLPVSGSHFPVGITLVTCIATDSHGNAASPVTFQVHLDYGKSTAQLLGSGNGVIPVTGGNTFDIPCSNSTIYSITQAAIDISFNNLCNFQSVINTQAGDGLPGSLPDGESFVEGLTVNILNNGSLVNPLPGGASITIAFPISSSQQNANLIALFWNGSKWVEVPGQMSSNGFFKITTSQPGTFLVISK